ncbi:unnamed protein product [Moneuplotes crassus]|uniref:Uncharacterized protein n=1 Tax=Euplotes crassus TaxID=5936 RepID=A0AAD1X9W5_EUPCR|nr:unnamed protein product [Moneuplotes crassus]
MEKCTYILSPPRLTLLKRDKSYYKSSTSISKTNIFSSSEKLDCTKNLKGSYSKLKRKSGMLKYRLKKNDQHKDNNHYTSKRVNKRAKNTPFTKYSSKDYFASRNLKSAIFEMKKNSLDTKASRTSLMDFSNPPAYLMPTDKKVKKVSCTIKGTAVSYTTKMPPPKEKEEVFNNGYTKEIAKIKEKLRESSKNRKKLHRMTNSTRFIKFDLQNNSRTDLELKSSLCTNSTANRDVISSTPKDDQTKLIRSITSPKRPADLSDTKFLSTNGDNTDASEKLEKEDLAQKLNEATTEIAKLKLDLQKERNLREMQICKLCSLQKSPKNGSTSISEYINKRLEKYKNEYEDDLLFQKFEKIAAEDANLASNKGSTANCSSMNNRSIKAISNDSISASSEVSSNKRLLTEVYPEEENSPKKFGFTNSKLMRKTFKQTSSTLDPEALKAMDKHQLVQMVMKLSKNKVPMVDCYQKLRECLQPLKLIISKSAYYP